MPYATQSDLVEHFGEDELIELTDRDTPPAGVIDAAVLAHAQAAADSEIDGYVAMRHALPLAAVPPRLTHLACDIARYHLYTAAVPDLVAQRYHDAIAWLRLVARGEVSLGLPELSGAAGMGLAEMVSEPRLFRRGGAR